MLLRGDLQNIVDQVNLIVEDLRQQISVLEDKITVLEADNKKKPTKSAQKEKTVV